MYILSDAEILSVCLRVQEYHEEYDQVTNDFFTVLLNTGCRPEELMNITRWTWNGISPIDMQPLKGNNLRGFQKADLTPAFIQHIEAQEQYFNIYSIDKYNYIFNKYNSFGPLRVQNKLIRNYLYRYNKVRQLRLEGWSFERITNWFGWTNSGIVTGYAVKEIYTE